VPDRDGDLAGNLLDVLMGRYEDYNDREECDTKFRLWKLRMDRFGMEDLSDEIHGGDDDCDLRGLPVDADNRLDGGIT
jgi:hypothetical protein